MKEITDYMKAYIDMLQLSYDLYCDALEDFWYDFGGDWLND